MVMEPAWPASADETPASAGALAWKDQIRSAFEALAEGDTDPLVSLLADDVEWQGRPAGVLRRRATAFGRTAALKQIHTLADTAQGARPGTWQVYHLLLRGGFAVVSIVWRAGDHEHEEGYLLRLGRADVTQVQQHRSYDAAAAALDRESY